MYEFERRNIRMNMFKLCIVDIGTGMSKCK
jgi:hypothetical protein